MELLCYERLFSEQFHSQVAFLHSCIGLLIDILPEIVI